MWKGCKHQWHPAIRTHTKPEAMPAKIGSISEESFERLMLGVSNLSQECKLCGYVRVETVTGKL